MICYPVDSLVQPDLPSYRAARTGWEKLSETIVPPREASCFDVPAGCFFRIASIEGPQVGDLNLWALHDLHERFYSGKTRALHGTHLSTGDRLWSSLPYLRPMATITEDTLDWYGFDEWGGSVHDVIGTRCDPYTHRLLAGDDYHHCCHSNLTRALADRLDKPRESVEAAVHDVLNVFMCTGFTRDTGQYFMKASPVRPGISLSSLRKSIFSAPCRPVRAAIAARAFERRGLLPPAAGGSLQTSRTAARMDIAPRSGYDRSHGP